ncbi:MAG: hypothetical protein HY069_01465 [Chlamydiia bacterium]|nr:hypothetical protein [Chlamydiia bacterium]
MLKEFQEANQLLATFPDFITNTLRGAHLSDEMTEVLSFVDKFYLLSVASRWVRKRGLFDLLCFYCEILLQASGAANELTPMVMEETRRLILGFRSKMVAWKRTPALHPLDAIFAYCLEIYEELTDKMRQLFQSLTPNFIESRTDENVLIHLIENRKKLNAYLGEGTIEHLLKALSPNGFSLLRTAICEGFTRRGFSAFYEEKEPLLDILEHELEEEEACLAQSPTLCS